MLNLLPVCFANHSRAQKQRQVFGQLGAEDVDLDQIHEP
jgi:hypothetical protein